MSFCHPEDSMDHQELLADLIHLYGGHPPQDTPALWQATLDPVQVHPGIRIGTTRLGTNPMPKRSSG